MDRSTHLPGVLHYLRNELPKSYKQFSRKSFYPFALTIDFTVVTAGRSSQNDIDCCINE